MLKDIAKLSCLAVCGSPGGNLALTGCSGPALLRAPEAGYDRTLFYQFGVFRTPVRVPFGMAQNEPKGHLGLRPKNPRHWVEAVRHRKYTCRADSGSPGGVLNCLSLPTRPFRCAKGYSGGERETDVLPLRSTAAPLLAVCSVLSLCTPVGRSPRRSRRWLWEQQIPVFPRSRA